jgi:hypothetical protein
MKKILLATILLVAGCTYYTEKQSENVSQTVYATSDSLGKGRVDLAYFYSNETTKFIKPPKHPIKISAIYEAVTVVKDSKTAEKTRVVIVPPQYKNDKVIIIGSTEYQQLLKDSADRNQFAEDNKNMSNQIVADNKELTHQKEMTDKMVKDLNHLQAEIYKKDLAILWRNIIIAVILVLIGGYFYLKTSSFALF